MQETKKSPFALERRHYIIAGAVIMFAFALQPFVLLFTQITLAPVIVPMLTGQNQDGTPMVEGKEVVLDNNRFRGDKDAKIVLVEFSDYECPFCARFHNGPKNVVANSGGEVAWAWKHFPLGFHPQAEPTAIAAECVNKLAGNDAFWSFTDTMMSNYDKLNDNLRTTEANKLGIATATFNTCLKDPEMKAIVDENLSLGASFGVNGTPNTLVVLNEGGKYTVLESINGALPEGTVQSIVDKYTK